MFLNYILQIIKLKVFCYLFISTFLWKLKNCIWFSFTNLGPWQNLLQSYPNSSLIVSRDTPRHTRRCNQKTFFKKFNQWIVWVELTLVLWIFWVKITIIYSGITGIVCDHFSNHYDLRSNKCSRSSPFPSGSGTRCSLKWKFLIRIRPRRSGSDRIRIHNTESNIILISKAIVKLWNKRNNANFSSNKKNNFHLYRYLWTCSPRGLPQSRRTSHMLP